MKKVITVIWILVLVAVLCGLGFYTYSYYEMKSTGNVHPVATFKIQNGETESTVKFELYPEYAPNTVTNFIKLIESGYYDGKIVYGRDDICMYLGRASGNEGDDISKGDVINPKLSTIDSEIEKDAEADHEYSIKGEFYNNDFPQNTLAHEKGILTMIRNDYSQFAQSQSSMIEEGYNSGNAQVAVMMTEESSSLNGLYAAFGRVIEGMDALEDIYNKSAVETPTEAQATEEGAEVETEAEEDEGGIKAFVGNIIISSATVETNGIDFGMPETQEMFDYEQYISDYYTQMYGGGSSSYSY